jgi:AcrR family transcriptional regulator
MSSVPVDSAPEAGVAKDAARPRRADAQRNYERVLAAATEVFAEHGAEASVALIARRAGVGAGTLFRHFPTKHDLLLAALEGRFDELQAAVADAERLEDGWESLVHVFTVAAEIQARDRGFLESVGPELFAEPRLQRRNSEYMASLGALVKRSQDAGLIRADLRAEDIPFLLSAVGGATGKCATVGLSPDIWRRYFGIILDGIRPAGASALPVAAPTLAQLTSTCQPVGTVEPVA